MPHPFDPRRLRSAYWRARAEETRLVAETMKLWETKRTMLEIAAGYDRLAELAEARERTA